MTTALADVIRSTPNGWGGEVGRARTRDSLQELPAQHPDGDETRRELSGDPAAAHQQFDVPLQPIVGDLVEVDARVFELLARPSIPRAVGREAAAVIVLEREGASRETRPGLPDRDLDGLMLDALGCAGWPDHPRAEIQSDGLGVIGRARVDRVGGVEVERVRADLADGRNQRD